MILPSFILQNRLHRLAPRTIDILQKELETDNGTFAIRLLRLIRIDRYNT